MKALIVRLKAKIEKIRLVVTDVDGVLTDSIVYYTPDGDYMRGFSVRDGMGVERLREITSIETIIISGESSDCIKKRAQKLGIKEVYIGIKNKLEVLQTIIRKKRINADEIAYIGDDLNDLDCLKAVGLSSCPSDAYEDLKKVVDIVCRQKGGHGAFRELAELIIKVKTHK
ncbi:MAG: HAD-IA family hydrolase [Thermodesulfovibrionales bacterium]|nr:HAD-IA family hydrolase [Thermodesulfovibrionales bacterium]